MPPFSLPASLPDVHAFRRYDPYRHELKETLAIKVQSENRLNTRPLLDRIYKNYRIWLWDRPAVLRWFPYLLGRRVAPWRGMERETIGNLLTEIRLDLHWNGLERGMGLEKFASDAWRDFRIINGLPSLFSPRSSLGLHVSYAFPRGAWEREIGNVYLFFGK